MVSQKISWRVINSGYYCFKEVFTLSSIVSYLMHLMSIIIITQLDDGDKVNVQQGDRLGFYYKNGNPIPYDKTSLCYTRTQAFPIEGNSEMWLVHMPYKGGTCADCVCIVYRSRLTRG